MLNDIERRTHTSTEEILELAESVFNTQYELIDQGPDAITAQELEESQANSFKLRQLLIEPKEEPEIYPSPQLPHPKLMIYRLRPDPDGTGEKKIMSYIEYAKTMGIIVVNFRSLYREIELARQRLDRTWLKEAAKTHGEIPSTAHRLKQETVDPYSTLAITLYQLDQLRLDCARTKNITPKMDEIPKESECLFIDAAPSSISEIAILSNYRTIKAPVSFNLNKELNSSFFKNSHTN